MRFLRALAHLLLIWIAIIATLCATAAVLAEFYPAHVEQAADQGEA